MHSSTFKQAEDFLKANTKPLIGILYLEYEYDTDYQKEWNQVAVWFTRDCSHTKSKDLE